MLMSCWCWTKRYGQLSILSNSYIFISELIVLFSQTLLQEVKRLRTELAKLQQFKTELEQAVQHAESEKLNALQLLDKMSCKIDDLNSENDRVCNMALLLR